MAKIKVLNKQIAELIAAGEVVERPASVVKEIVENSIDAGATSITIEIKSGGVASIRVTDNGSGIMREDVPSAFLSHATSKIDGANDLNAIATLGFRGEALASVAAVSKVEILTRAAGEELGTRYCIEGGEEILLDDAGCPKGTTIIIKELFYNTPARMKFLKKDVSEANAVAAVADRLALSHPEISFRLIRDDKQTLLTPGDGDLFNTAHAVFGKEFAAGLIKAEYEYDGVRVAGYVSKPSASRPNRNMQFFFINGRLIKTGTGSAALSEGYKNSIMSGKFPSCILDIQMNPSLVDVNVHPAKTEVRFANDRAVFQAVYYCAKSAISGGFAPPQVKMPLKGTQKPNEGFWEKMTLNEFAGNEKKAEPHREEKTLFQQSPAPAPLRLSSPEEEFFVEREESTLPAVLPVTREPQPSAPLEKEDVGSASFEEAIRHSLAEAGEEPAVIGEAFNCYIIVESGGALLIIDKHAAHERMIFEKLMAEEGDRSAQVLLAPVTVSLSKEEYSALLDNLEPLKNAGFEIEDFGAGSVIIRECPMELESDDIAEVIAEIAGKLIDGTTKIMPEKLDWIYHSVSCRSAIKAGDFTSPYEREIFVKKLLSMPEIRHCPHGRPVMVEMTRKEIEKSFGRI